MSDTLPNAQIGGGNEVLIAERASATPDDAVLETAPSDEAEVSTAVLSLAETQAWFSHVSTFAGSVADAVASAPFTQQIRAVVRGDARMSAHARMSVYHYGYAARLIECLLDDYPAVAHALGEASFEALCRGYISAHPSRGPNLNPFGRFMPAYIRKAELDVEHFDGRREFLADLATLEWTLVEVLHAQAPPPLSAETLGAIEEDAWPRAKLRRSETARVVRFSYPVNRYYQAFRQGDPIAPPDAAPSATLVYRHAQRLWRLDLTPAMAKLVEGLFSGMPLGEAMGAIEETITNVDELEDAERNVGIWFQEWIGSSVFAAVELEAGKATDRSTA